MFAKRARGLKMSGIRKMFDLAGSSAVNLGLGEPDFQPPSTVVEAMKKALDGGYNKYGPTGGLRELREALAKMHSSQADVRAENVLITVGATEALAMTMQVFVDPGDEVLTPDPGFVLFAPHVRLAGGTPVFYSVLEKDYFLPTLDELESLVGPRTKAIIINSPSNPTGSVMREKEVEALTAFAEDNGLLIISDEVYDRIVYEGQHVSFLGRTENVIYVNSFSKVFSMTGWRLGYLIAGEEFVKTMAKVHYYMVACPPTPAQYAVLTGLLNSQEYLREMLDEFRRRRDFIVSGLNSIGGFHCITPGGAFYAFPSFEFDIGSEELAMRLLEAGVVCSPGSAFGERGEGHLRFSYAASLELIGEALVVVDSVARDLDVEGRAPSP